MLFGTGRNWNEFTPFEELKAAPTQRPKRSRQRILVVDDAGGVRQLKVAGGGTEFQGIIIADFGWKQI
jgi:hypothetical protein